MEVRCVMCMGRGHCDHADWTFDENGAALTADDIADCPDFELDPDHISEVVAAEVLVLDPDMFAQAHVQFSLPDKLWVRIFLVENVLDDKEKVQEMLEEVRENLEYLSKGTIGIQDMLIQVDFVFAQEDNPEIPNSLPADIVNQFSRDEEDDPDDERDDREFGDDPVPGPGEDWEEPDDYID